LTLLFCFVDYVHVLLVVESQSNFLDWSLQNMKPKCKTESKFITFDLFHMIFGYIILYCCYFLLDVSMNFVVCKCCCSSHKQVGKLIPLPQMFLMP